MSVPSGTVNGLDPRIGRTRHDVLSTTVKILIDEGWDAVTHAHVAAAAGYSKATVYKHWPTRTKLIGDAFGELGEMAHHLPTGDVRSDLIAEVGTFSTGMEQQRLDRALCALVELAHRSPDLVEIREKLVTDGEKVVRELLAPMLSGAELEAATLMLVGAVLHSALMHGAPPADTVIAASVDLVLRACPAL